MFTFLSNLRLPRLSSYSSARFWPIIRLNVMSAHLLDSRRWDVSVILDEPEKGTQQYMLVEDGGVVNVIC